MGSRGQVVYHEIVSPLSEEVLEGLSTRGYKPLKADTFDAAAQKLARISRGILLVECGSSKDSTVAAIKELVEAEALHGFPIVIVGAGAESYDAVLSRHFRIASTVDLPCDTTRILNAVAYTLIASEKTDGPEGQKEPTLVENLFNQFFQRNILEQNLGGRQYPRLLRQDQLPTSLYLPTRPKQVATLVLELSELVTPKALLHLHRIAFLTHLVTEALRIDPETKEAAKASAFLWARAVARKRGDFITREFPEVDADDYRKSLAAAVREAGTDLDRLLGPNKLRNVLFTMGALSIDEQQDASEETRMAASIVLGSEIVDRTAFPGGRWSPRAAHRLLRCAKENRLPPLHPAALCCLVKIVAEAVASTQGNLLLERKITDNAKLQAQAQRFREEPLESHEERVEITNLAPGMRITRPVVAFDGRTILDAGINLDEDLIWRLWQLSAIRPLNGPMVITRSEPLVAPE